MNFEEYREKHPEAKFSDYYVYKLVSTIESGQPHGALGKDLYRGQERIAFEEAGRNEFDKYSDWFGLHPEMRVIDYGCGSLRLGLHFIRFLAKGNYFGLDITTDFITPGKQRLNEIMGSDWVAEIGTIEERFEDAVEHGADLVFSSNVAYHVHPEECQDYFERLTKLAGKPGSILVFDTRIAKDTLRFGDRNWAFPFEFQAENLPNFDLIQTFPNKDKLQELMKKNEVVRVIFHFERAR